MTVPSLPEANWAMYGPTGVLVLNRCLKLFREHLGTFREGLLYTVGSDIAVMTF